MTSLVVALQILGVLLAIGVIGWLFLTFGHIIINFVCLLAGLAILVAGIKTNSDVGGVGILLGLALAAIGGINLYTIIKEKEWFGE